MAEEKNLKTQYNDTAMLAFSVLKRLGTGKVDTFEQRLRSQKIQYLAQVFGVSPIYSFGLYLRGPYSSSLAHDLFRLHAEKEKPNTEKFIPNDLEDQFGKLKKFLADHQGTRDLELIATLHWLIKAGFTKTAAARKLVEIKEATDEEIAKTFNAIPCLP